MIDLLSQATLDPGDEIVCGWPSFPSYVLDAAKLGAVSRKVPLRDQTYDLDAMLAAIGGVLFFWRRKRGSSTTDAG